MTRDEVKKIIAKLTILYPHFTVGEAVCGLKPTDVWFEMIGDMDYGKADKAVRECAQRCKFPPTIADIREEYFLLCEEERKEVGDIRRFYEQARSYYPNCGEVGYGWKEFWERANTRVEAEKLQNLIIGYVNSTESDCIDFVECIRTVRRENGKILVG